MTVGERRTVVAVPTRRSARWWWRAPLASGAALALVPVVALTVTDRQPDPLFLRFWWSPIASVPVETLGVGTLGLVLLLATGAAALLTLAVPVDRRRRGLLLALTLAVGAVGIGGLAAVAGARSDTAVAATSAVLLRRTPPVDVSPQARRAMQLALGRPAPTAKGIRIVRGTTVPAGPWLVETIEVRNRNLSDEGADVQVGTLIDPLDGDVLAAWFWGL